MSTTFDIDTLRRGHHDRDADTLTDLYTDDAVLRIVDVTHPPSNPREIKGRDAIHAYMDDLCARDMTHEIEDEVIGGDMASWMTACRYATGERVLATEVAHLRDGRIDRETMVQAWDA